MKKIVVILMVLAGISVAGTLPVEKDTVLSLSIVTTGDTAKVLQFKPAFAIDSFKYQDSIRVQADTSVFDTVSWVSPVQSWTLTPTLDTQSTYVCSLLTAGALGFTWVCPEDATLDTVIERLLDSINAVTGMSDTITADTDAAHSYLIVTSNFAQITFPSDARPRLKAVVSGGTGTITKDSTICTKEMVCDSMVAKVNARDTMAAYVLAANRGDTAYVLTALDAGLFFWGAAVDTTQDTSTLTANKASRSIINDTIILAPAVTNSQNFTGAYMTIIVDSSVTTTSQGIGLSDSCYLRVLARRDIGKNVEYFSVYRDSAAGLPCTLRVSRSAATAGGDTLFKEVLYLNYLITDTASDTTVTMKHQLHIDGRLYEQ